MSLETTVHLNFRGQAREALEFYASVFGGDLMALTHADAHTPAPAEEAGDLTWGQVRSEAGFHVMAFDVPSTRPYDAGTDAVFVSVRVTHQEELRGYWKALIDGGSVRTPLEPSMWSPLYGMVTDRFGVTWVLDVVAEYAG